MSYREVAPCPHSCGPSTCRGYPSIDTQRKQSSIRTGAHTDTAAALVAHQHTRCPIGASASRLSPRGEQDRADAPSRPTGYPCSSKREQPPGRSAWAPSAAPFQPAHRVADDSIWHCDLSLGWIPRPSSSGSRRMTTGMTTESVNIARPSTPRGSGGSQRAAVRPHSLVGPRAPGMSHMALPRCLR